MCSSDLPVAVSAASEKALDQLSGEAKIEAPAAPQTSPAPFSDGRFWVVVRAADKAARTRAAETGLSIEDIRPGTIAGVAHETTLSQLRAQGFEIVKATPLLRFIQDFPPSDAEYHDYAEMASELKAIAQAAPGLASVFSIGKTVQGRDILALRLNTDASGTAPSAKPGAVFTGTFHAREHLSTEVALLLGRFLVEKKDDPKVRELLRTRDVYILPMINPDGAEFDISTGEYQWHRKNMSRNSDGSTGVDLNRNYGYLWGGAGSSGSPWSDTYRGPSAFSEPESKAFKSFLEARRNVKTLISYHSYGELVLYPWGGSDLMSPTRTWPPTRPWPPRWESSLATPRRNPGSHGHQTHGLTYAACIFSFTIELGGGWFKLGLHHRPGRQSQSQGGSLSSRLERRSPPCRARRGSRPGRLSPIPALKAARLARPMSVPPSRPPFSAAELFRGRFPGEPALFKAPGRVNLIGEHTDYNSGFVMPAAVDAYAWGAVAPRPDLILRVFSREFEEQVDLDLARIEPGPASHWSDYVRGVAGVCAMRASPSQGPTSSWPATSPAGA